MALKATCPTLKKVADDEPIFVLRAQDLLSSQVVEYWAELAQMDGSPREKTLEALECANAMRRWRTANGGGKFPD